jgi:hypothetical protein
LKTALKTGAANKSPPVVSPAKSRSRTPSGRRRGIPDFDGIILRSPSGVKTANIEEEDMFANPPSVVRRKQPVTDVTVPESRDSWENAALSCVKSVLPISSADLSSCSTQQLYDTALEEMRLLSRLSDTTGGSNILEKQRVISSMYHANVARILLCNGMRRAAEKNERVLKAKMADKISRICDYRNELKTAIEFAEKASNCWKSLGMPLRSLSSSLHILAMCCEDNDVDKAELMAMRVADDRQSDKSIKEAAVGYLNTIREAMKMQKMKLLVDRSEGWPFVCLLKPE